MCGFRAIGYISYGIRSQRRPARFGEAKNSDRVLCSHLTLATFFIFTLLWTYFPKLLIYVFVTEHYPIATVGPGGASSMNPSYYLEFQLTSPRQIGRKLSFVILPPSFITTMVMLHEYMKFG